MTTYTVPVRRVVEEIAFVEVEAETYRLAKTLVEQGNEAEFDPQWEINAVIEDWIVWLFGR